MDKVIFESIKKRCSDDNVKPLSDGIIGHDANLFSDEIMTLVSLEQSIKEINVIGIQDEINTIKSTISLISELDTSIKALQATVDTIVQNMMTLQNTSFGYEYRISALEQIHNPVEPEGEET